MSAEWWNQPGGGTNDVKRQTPDDGKYHLPDAAMMGKISPSKVGAFAVVPAARKDGASRGFDPTVAGPVHVDPQAPDGGVVFDAAAVRDADLASAVSRADYPHEAYYDLAARPPGLPDSPPPPASNPHMPNAFVVPRQEVATVVNHSPPNSAWMPPSPPQQLPPQPPAGFPQPQAVFQGPQQFPQPFQPQDQAQAMMLSMMQMFAESQRQLIAQMQPQQPQHQQPAPLPMTGVSRNPMPTGRAALATLPVETQGRARPAPAEDFDETARPIRRVRKPDEADGDEAPPPPTRVRDVIAASDPPDNGVVFGFEALNIPFVRSPLPVKPKVAVLVDVPNAGQTQAKFHGVIETDECLVLVYDTRYEDGVQYRPPNLGEVVFTVNIPSRKKTYNVSFMNQAFTFGVFDIIVLVKAGGEQVDYQGEDYET